MVAITTHHAESPGDEWFYMRLLEVENFILSWYFWMPKERKMQGINVNLTAVLIEDSKVKNFPS